MSAKAQTVDARGKPGQVVKHRSGETKVLSHRKEGDVGWWLTDGSGLTDEALDGKTWTLLDEFAETPEQRRLRLVESLARHSPRHRRMAESLLGADDPVFAVADLLVDHEARLDTMNAQIRSIEIQLIYLRTKDQRSEQ